jgi:hypothetical protein
MELHRKNGEEFTRKKKRAWKPSTNGTGTEEPEYDTTVKIEANVASLLCYVGCGLPA